MMGSPAEVRESRALARWQQRLLPFLVVAISLMAIFFFVSTLLQLGRLGEAVAYKPDLRVDQSLAAYEQKAGPEARDQDYLHWKTLVLLEESAIQHRYAQVSATLMLRAWTRHLGFLTGMILALVGAIFILAKLSESETRLSGEAAGAKGALATNSPGIVLAVLGTVLMVVTLTTDFSFTTTDVPVYLRTAETAGAPLPPPQPLDSDAARKAEEASLFPAAPEASPEASHEASHDAKPKAGP